MTSPNGNIFLVTGPLCGEFTGHRWIPRTKASDAELWCFLWSAPWINGWVNNCENGDLRRHSAHYDVIVMSLVSRFHSQLGYSLSYIITWVFLWLLWLIMWDKFIAWSKYIWKTLIFHGYVSILNFIHWCFANKLIGKAFVNDMLLIFVPNCRETTMLCFL